MKVDKEQILLGSLLGDGSIEWGKLSKNPRFIEDHSLKQSDYLLWKKELLPFPTRYVEYLNRKYPICCICSRSSPIFKKYYEWKYKNQINEIIKRLELFGLLIWYLDDGSYHYYNNSSALHTLSFPYHINLFIQRWLQSKFSIKSQIRRSPSNKQNHFLTLSTNSTQQLLELFKSYIPLIPQNMHYKLGLDKVRKNKILRNRKQYAMKYRQQHRQKINRKQRKWRHRLGISIKYIGKYQKELKENGIR